MQHAVTNPSAQEDVASILEMKRAWNLATPVSRLHPEIVSTIFCLVRDAFANFSILPMPTYLGIGHSTDTPWVALTHVCHGWREIAINTPSLWSYIVCTSTNYKWAEEALRRSKRCLLSIILLLPATVKTLAVFGVVRKLKAQLDRCHILLLVVPYFVARAFLKSDAPHLEQLSIGVIPFPEDISRYGPLSLPENAQQMNSLRRLSLNPCQIDWITPLCDRLTHLEIASISAAGLTCKSLVATISKMTALESLSFRQFNMENVTVDLSATTRIELPHLRFLFADCELGNMAYFLHSVILPPFCRLRLWVFDDVYGGPHLYSVLLWLSTRFGSSTHTPKDNFPSLRSISLFGRQFVFRRQFVIEGFSEILSHEEIKNTIPLLEFLVLLPGREPDARAVVDSLLVSFPLSHANFLEVLPHSDIEIPESTWKKVFGSHPFVESIYLDTNSRTLLGALIPIDDDSSTDRIGATSDGDTENAGTAGDSRTADGLETVPFAALSTIILGSKFVDYFFLIGVLRDRSEHGVRLQQLLFWEKRGLPPASVLSQLEKIVSYVGRQTSRGSTSVRPIQSLRDGADNNEA